MAKSYVSGVIDAPVERVWSLLRDFNGVGTYFAEVVTSALADGARGDQVGCLRTAQLRDGSSIQERLLALSDVDRSLSYTLVEQPNIPVINYESTIRLRPVTQTDATFMEWSAIYDIKSEDDAAVRDFVENGIYMTCIRSLQKMLGQSAEVFNSEDHSDRLP